MAKPNPIRKRFSSQPLTVPRYYIETYGCVANKVDSEIIIAALESKGWERVESPEKADLIIVNTCGVKEKTEGHNLSRIKKLYALGKRIVVIGCLPNIAPEKIRAIGDIPMFGPREWDKLSQFLGVPLPKEKVGVPKKREEPYIASIFIQEGCLGACTFCATKFARGHARSFSKDGIVREVKEAVREGRIEIRLTGQDLGTWGYEFRETLVDLLSDILEKVSGNYAIRVGMINPEHMIKLIDNGYLGLFKDERLYKFFHIPLQSGSDMVLRLMGRKYTVNDFLEICRKIRKAYPYATIETDIIVGFPGERPEDFYQSIFVLRKAEVDVVNISRFSPRPKTPAARMPNQVPSNEKKRRSRILTEITHRLAFVRNLLHVGRKTKAFAVELGRKGGIIAHTQEYKHVLLPRAELGEIRKVKLVRAFPYYLLGEPLE